MQYRPHVAAAAAALGLEVLEIDIDEDPDRAQQLGVHSLPAVALDSEPENLVFGLMSTEDLVAHLRSRLG